jgi:Xaa-Pro aminopeptidase
VKSRGKSTAPRFLAAQGAGEAEIRHLTGFAAPDVCHAAQLPRGTVLFVSALEAARAAKTAAGRAEIVTYGELKRAAGAQAGTPAENAAFWLARQGVKGVSILPDAPWELVRAAERAGLAVVPEKHEISPARAVKTPREIRAVAEAQRAAVAAYKTAEAMLHASSVDARGRLVLGGKVLTSERLRAKMAETMMERGAYPVEGTIASCGDDAARPHESGHGPLRADESIVLDIFPRNERTGYWGDLTRTVVKGNPSKQLRAMHRAVAAAQRLAFGMLRAGVEGRKVHRAVAAFFEREGYPTDTSRPGKECGFFHGLGHGVGLAIHESPGLREAPGKLPEGAIVTVEPGLYYPGIGGVRIEDTVLVTKTGFRFLATCPRRFVIP